MSAAFDFGFDSSLNKSKSNSKAADKSVRPTQAECSFVTDRGVGSGFNGPMAKPTSLDRTYEYRRRLPHYQKPGQAIFVTFCKQGREPFSTLARDLVLQHCVHDNGKRICLHAAVVMPEHVHMLLMPMVDEQGWPYAMPAILKQIKGVSARSVNRLPGCSWPVWQEESFDHVLRSTESFAEKLEHIRQNPVRRGLGLRPEDYQWLWVCGADTLVRRL